MKDYLIYRYSAWEVSPSLITFEQMIRLRHLPPIYVASAGLLEELHGMFLLANQEAELYDIMQFPHHKVDAALHDYIHVYRFD